MRRHAALLVMLVVAVAAAGCGADDDTDTGLSSRLVDLDARPPLINSLERDERSDELLLTTNRGLYRIDP